MKKLFKLVWDPSQKGRSGNQVLGGQEAYHYLPVGEHIQLAFPRKPKKERTSDDCLDSNFPCFSVTECVMRADTGQIILYLQFLPSSHVLSEEESWQEEEAAVAILMGDYGWKWEDRQ